MQTSNRVFALIPCSLAWPKTLADRGGNGAQLRFIEAFNISSHLYINAASIYCRSWPLQACDAELTRRLDPAIIGGVTKGIVTKYLADANGGSRRILRPDCRSGISRICWKIDCQGELNRLRTIDHRRVAIDRYGCSTY